MDGHDAPQLAGGVMHIEFDAEALPRSLRRKMDKAAAHMLRVGRQAARVRNGSFVVGEQSPKDDQPSKEGHTTGLERILAWALPKTRPGHLDGFLESLGNSACSLLLNNRCTLCPAKGHSTDKRACRRVLGAWLVHDFKEGRT
jgi:hypothetical protein